MSIQHWVLVTLFHMRPGLLQLLKTSHIMVTPFLFTQPIEEGGKVWCCVDLVLDIVYFTWNQCHSGVLRQTSLPAGQAVQQYSGISIVSIDVSCSILGIYIWHYQNFRYFKQVDNICYILYRLFQNFRKSKFCANVHKDQFTRSTTWISCYRAEHLWIWPG